MSPPFSKPVMASDISVKIKLCEYPSKSRDKVRIHVSDYKTLDKDTYVNDSVVDLYLQHLLHFCLNEQDNPKVHLFNSMFYARLSGNASFPGDKNLTPHEKVRRWTKGVNIFEKDMVIIPICHQSHWFTVIVARPYLLAAVGNQDLGKPFLLVLDSLGRLQVGSAFIVKKYLVKEWGEKMSENEESHLSLNLSKKYDFFLK